VYYNLLRGASDKELIDYLISVEGYLPSDADQMLKNAKQMRDAYSDSRCAERKAAMQDKP
jgi:hypothetical protein